MSKKRIFSHLRENWSILTFYERFEQIVSLVLSLIVMTIIFVALLSLINNTIQLSITKMSQLGGHNFSVVFGSIMSLLIALEFNHTIFHSIKHKGQIVRVKTVVLIAILVMAREFILLDSIKLENLAIFAYGFAALCLGLVYFLLDIRDEDS